MSLDYFKSEYREVFGSSTDAFKIQKVVKETIFDALDQDECFHSRIDRYSDGRGSCIECGSVFLDPDDLTSIIKECKHENVIMDKGLCVCKDCCVEIQVFDFSPEWRFYGQSDNKSFKDPSRCRYSKSNNRNLDPIFDSCGVSIPEKIRDVTQEKYNKIVDRLRESKEKNTVRGKRKKSIVAACLFYSYRESGEYRTSDYIRNFFDLSQKNMSTGMFEYSKTFPDDRKNTISPENLIRWQMTLSGIHISHYKKILAIARYLNNASEILTRSNPQSVSAAILYFYLCLNPEYKTKLGLTKSKFASRVDLSDITITKLVQEISRVSKCEIQV
jgi:transcription initiation factor TFIIIB Brf1 subunit/transcription initiation factor TFIIB